MVIYLVLPPSSSAGLGLGRSRKAFFFFLEKKKKGKRDRELEARGATSPFLMDGLDFARSVRGRALGERRKRYVRINDKCRG